MLLLSIETFINARLLSALVSKMELKDQVMKTGTTVVGVVCKDGIVIGADRRATLGGTFIAHKKMQKVVFLMPNVVVATAGNVSDIQLFLKITKAELKLKQLRSKIEPTVKQAANLLASLAYQSIRNFSPLMSIAAFLVGGKDSKGFWLYEVSPDGSVALHDDYVAVGSGMVMAYGVLESKYKQDINVEQGVKLVVDALNAAMQRDTPTGSGFDVVVITKDGAKKVLEGKAEIVLKEIKK